MRLTIIRYADARRVHAEATALLSFTSKRKEVAMRQMLLRMLCCSTLLIVAALLSAGPLRARPVHAAFPQSNQKQNQQQHPSDQKQTQNNNQQTPQPDQGYSSSSTTQAAANSPNDNSNTKPDVEMQNRYKAEQDIEVGDFYLHKGDPDAAIPRLEEAARLRPHYGKPRLLLAECYEKKHDPDNAVKYLKEYLKVYPHAPDAKKVREKIKKLEKQES
jgi:tetratricopeptide (TPR) repeat protein